MSQREGSHAPVEPGKEYIINEGWATEGRVVVVHCHGKYFCRVRAVGGEYEWETMCYRLTDPDTRENAPE